MKKKPSTTKDKKPKADKTELMKPAHIRFCYLYLGAEDGKCFNNATMSYFRAFYPELNNTKTEKGDYLPQYETSKTEGNRLLTKPHIKAFIHETLLIQGYKPENIKKRFAELANQNKNLPLALSANDRLAKISGIIVDDKKVDIPQLDNIANMIKSVLEDK